MSDNIKNKSGEQNLEVNAGAEQRAAGRVFSSSYFIQIIPIFFVQFRFNWLNLIIYFFCIIIGRHTAVRITAGTAAATGAGLDLTKVPSHELKFLASDPLAPVSKP